MSERVKVTGCLPSGLQELLLKAALLKGAPATDAWSQWKSEINLDRIDHDSSRLLPLLYHNLIELGIEDPLMERFKGSHRKTWYKNQVILHQASDLLQTLHDNGIQTILLKGAPLMLLYYKDPGLRPMEDVDVLVPVEQALEASNLLIDKGWKPRFPSREMQHEIYFSCRHAHGFEDGQGRHFDLHWHVLYECSYTDADDDFWEKAIPLKVNEIISKTLCPTDQLFHTIVHGIRWNPRPMLRWVADAMMILRSTGEIDWERLIVQSQGRRLSLYLRNGLTFLFQLLDAPIPEDVLLKFHSLNISRFEKREYKILNSRLGPSGGIFVKWFQYARFKKDTSFLRRVTGIPKYLKAVWGVRRWWQLPYYFVYKLFEGFKNFRAIKGKRVG